MIAFVFGFWIINEFENLSSNVSPVMGKVFLAYLDMRSSDYSLHHRSN